MFTYCDEVVTADSSDAVVMDCDDDDDADKDFVDN